MSKYLRSIEFLFIALAFLTVFLIRNTPALGATTIYEAENATIVNGVLETTHAGYSGTGYVDFTNAVGGYVEWTTVSAAQAGVFSLTFRFANGTTTNRPMEIRVNGTVISANLAFNATGAWTTWDTQTISTTLKAGSNIIRATGTTANGGPNLDNLAVTVIQTSTATNTKTSTASPSPGTLPPLTNTPTNTKTPTPSPTKTPTFVPTTPTPSGPDWGKLVVDSTMSRFPTAAALGSWGYAKALFLYGEYLVYKRTGDKKYLTYIQNWVDQFVDSSGKLNVNLSSLDVTMPGQLLLVLYQETKLAKYKTAADTIRHRFDTWPRTSDGGFWHALSRQHQLWLDGTFMSLPFLGRYGDMFNDSTYTDHEIGNQLLIYYKHLINTSNGLMYHAYDESGTQSWVVAGTLHSPESWCRAMGWYTVTSVEVLDVLPLTDPNRPLVLSHLQGLITAISRYQDTASGRWFEVVDKGSLSTNWTETSCSSMFTYVIAKSIAKGYVSAATYNPIVSKGFNGVMQKVSLGSDGLTNITDIVIGTNVGDLNYYLGRTRATNDFHGLGAFLIMYEELVNTGVAKP